VFYHILIFCQTRFPEDGFNGCRNALVRKLVHYNMHNIVHRIFFVINSVIKNRGVLLVSSSHLETLYTYRNLSTLVRGCHSRNIGYRTTGMGRHVNLGRVKTQSPLSGWPVISRSVSCAIVHWASAPAGLCLDYRHYCQSIEVAASTRRFEFIVLGINFSVFTFALIF
jgi:hypothetical protein